MSVDLASPSTTRDRVGLGRAGASAALIGSAMVHATVLSDHYREWALAGLFFLALQVAETLLGLAVLLAGGRRVAIAVVAGNLATLGVWALSRTAGLPFGPPVFRVPEAVGAADLACVALELLAIILLLPCALAIAPERLLRRPHWPTLGHRGRTAVAVGVLATVVAVTGWGLTPALQGQSHHHAAASHH